MKKLLLILTFFWICTFGTAQNQQEIDSLLMFAQTTKSEELKIELYNEVFKNYYYHFQYSEAEAFIKKYNTDIKDFPSKKARLYFMYGNIHYAKYNLVERKRPRALTFM